MKTSNRGFWIQLLLGRKTSMIREMEYEHLKGISYREIMSTWQSGECIKKGNTHDCLLSIGCYSICQYAGIISCIPRTYSIKVGIVIIFIWCLWPGAYPQLLLSLSTFSNGSLFSCGTEILAHQFICRIWLHENQLIWGCSEYLRVCRPSISSLPLWEPPVLQWIQTW